MTGPGRGSDVIAPIPNPAYTVPSYGDRDWNDSPINAWAPGLHSAPGETPDPMRMRLMPTADYRPAPADPPQDFWLGAHGVGRDEMQRHRVEFVDADGFETRIDGYKHFAPNPRSTPPPEPRLTSRMSPLTYVFTRPFDQTPARHLNGQHFSMADHRRQYPILGMQPVVRRRNTFRTEPAPWDTDLVDMPATMADTPRPGQIPVYEIPPRNHWRL